MFSTIAKRTLSTASTVTKPVLRLSKNKVKLVSCSAPSLSMTGEKLENVQDLIAYSARVSNPSNQNNKKTSSKLIKYLVKHKHWSPLEMVSACVEIETPRDIARQILRHRSFAFQEFSQRYANPVKDMKFVLREPRLQDTKNRQNSIDTYDAVLEEKWYEMQEKAILQAIESYTFAIENGVAKEQARAVLPEGNTMSRMYMNGTLRSWIHYIELRSENGTQKEHMDVANKCAEEIAKIFPLMKEFVEE